MPNNRKEKCTERNCKNEVAKKNPGIRFHRDQGRPTVTLSDTGNEVAYESWMGGFCSDCITGIKEFEGEMSETPYSDYMPTDAVNREWDRSY